MKKQLLAAAVAATMTSVAMADISLTGDAKVNYTNVDSATEASDQNTFKHDINLTLQGSNGDTGVLVRTSTKEENYADNSPSTALTLEDAYVTSKIGDVNVKFGQYNNTSDSMISNATNGTINSGRFTADTTIGGVKVTYVDQNASAESVILSGEFNGISVSHKMAGAGAGSTNDYTDTKLSGSVAGVDLYYRSKNFDNAGTSTDSDMEVFKIGADLNGVAVTYAQAEADHASDTFSMDSEFGEYSSVNNTKGVKAKTSIAGNGVTVAVYEIGETATAATDDYTKFVITRPLASGATFEATYTDKDAAAGSTSDSTTLDLELAVKF